MTLRPGLRLSEEKTGAAGASAKQVVAKAAIETAKEVALLNACNEESAGFTRATLQLVLGEPK